VAKISNLLDDVQLKHWVGKGEAVAKSDGDGLTFTLSKAGTATWVLRYRFAGRRKELTLGNYPDMSLSAARKKARECRVAIDNGGDPATLKQEEKTRSRDAWLMRDLVADYQAKRLLPSEFAEATIYYRKWDYDNVILPKLGGREVRKVTATDVVDMLTNCKRSWTICKRILTSTSQLFDHACGQQLIVVNPCTGISLRAVIGSRPPVKKRIMLTEEELRALLPAIDDIGTENALAFRILLATCVRGVELVKAKKEHIDFERGTWWIPDDSVKTRQGFLVPLVPVVQGWFRDLFALAGESDWILPARTERRRRAMGGDTHVCSTTLWASFARAFDRGDIEIRKFTPHDTRSTAKGHMRNMGVSREISEIALNHTMKGMEAIYDVREEIPERREALAKWTDFLVACEAGTPAPTNVIPFRQAAA
jgi:integrase